MKSTRAFVSILLLCAAFGAKATDFYIDPVDGSDSGDGSATNPWHSLQAVFDANLIETQDWPSYPYTDGMQLVTVNAGAPVHAGDTLWLRSGYHGDLVIEHDHPLGSRELTRELVQHLLPLAGDPVIEPRAAEPRFLPVHRSFFFPR